MFFLLLVACAPANFSKPADSSNGNFADTAEADTANDDTGSPQLMPCYQVSLEGGHFGCYETMPYISIDSETMVPVIGDEGSVAWDITVSAAPEGWVIINDLYLSLVFDDRSGSGWIDHVMDHITFTDQNDREHGIGVENSNPAVKSLAIGEVVGSAGDVAVPTVDAGDDQIVTVAIDITDLDLSNDDTIGLNLGSYQTWSYEGGGPITSQFNSTDGTVFLFP